jgi:hypothetical protein
MARWTNAEIVDWLRVALEQSGVTQRALAEVWGVTPGVVSHMFNDEEPRKVTAEEIIKAVALTRVQFPGFQEQRLIESTAGGILLSVRGKLAAHTWSSMHEGEPVDFKIPAIIHARYPSAQQRVWMIAVPPTPSAGYYVGDFIVAVPFASYRAQALPGDKIVFRRKQGNLVNYVLRQAEPMDGEMIYTPLLSGDHDGDEGYEVEPYDLVIGMHRFEG